MADQIPTTPPNPQIPHQDYSEVQEYFSDVFETHVNPWSAVITFGLRATKDTDTTIFNVRMRMPLQQAKALAAMVMRNIRAYEDQSGADIDLPRVVLDSLGIPPEDWERFKGA